MDKLKDILNEALLLQERKLRVFDFDDTIAKTGGKVRIQKKGGKIITLDSEEFAKYVFQKGDQPDFRDFEKITDPQSIIYTSRFLNRLLRSGERGFFTILTARPKASARRIRQYLKSMGFGDINVVALQSSDPYDKAKWIANQIENRGYDDVLFVDDSSNNIRAVKSLQNRFPKAQIKVLHIGDIQRDNSRWGDFQKHGNEYVRYRN